HDGVHEAGSRLIIEPEVAGQVRAAEIRVDEENARVGGLGKGAREVDRSRRLAVSSIGARDGDHRELGGPVELLDHVAERPILLGLERGWREQAHQMIVELVSACAEPSGRWPRGREYGLGRSGWSSVRSGNG